MFRGLFRPIKGRIFAQRKDLTPLRVCPGKFTPVEALLKNTQSSQLNKYTQLLRSNALNQVRFYSTKPEPPQGLFSRLKFMLIKQNRPFNADEISAFLSWILMGNFMLILIGTTTFIGSIFYLVNTFGDGELNKAILKRMFVFDNGLRIDIDDPKFQANWEDGKIKFKNVVVESSLKNTHLKYTLKIDEINVTLSLRKWINRKGLIHDVEIDGLDGDVYLNSSNFMVDSSFHGNYELGNFKVTHSKIIFHDDHIFREPLELILFNCEMNRLRRNWIVYDFLDANSMFGSIGGSLFTLHKRQNQIAHFSGVDSIIHGETDQYENEIWKKTTRLRIDMLDLSYLNNETSKMNWIESGKVELIFDIMLPSEDDTDSIAQLNVDYSWDGLKKIGEDVKYQLDKSYKKLIGKEDEIEYEDVTPINKYVVIDMKINFYELNAREITTSPVSSLTGEPYIPLEELQSLVTFINDEKFGLSSPKFNSTTGNDQDDGYYDSSDIELDDSEELEDDNDHQLKGLPPIKFRIVQNLNNFEFLDLPSLLSCATMECPNENSDIGSIKCFQNTNKFIDASVYELLVILMVYKHEIQGKMIDMYAKRSGFEILFNNFILGNLILVGLGTFVI